ncbi:MAG: hypothetical protein GF346_09215, partial [Candidatus Eisenbacteria bacterium]|nr:hypothetical protein [Candidatus Latescibacterota bacterium]MBD3302610.1 hypothetical protein [Candidatus Eisenbacteria bacterium]
MSGRSVLALAAWIVILSSAGPATGASSWTLSVAPDGSGRWVESYGTSVWILGRFGDANVWRSDDGGFEGRARAPGLPFPADSVGAFSIGRTGGFVLDRSGGIWASPTGAYWERYPGPPDSAGAPTCLRVAGNDLWLGTESGWILSSPTSDDAWRVAATDAGDTVREVYAREPDGFIVRLDDGRILTHDSLWTAAPFSARVFALHSETGVGYALERGTRLLWRTEDAGITWSIHSDALAAEDLAGRAAGARMLRFDPRGPFLIPSGDALLASDDDGRSFFVAADGTGMFLDASIDALGGVLAVGARIHRSTDRAHTMKLLSGGRFGRVAFGNRRTFWALDAGLLLSIDRGEEWLRQPLPRDPAGLRRIAARGDYEIRLHFDDGVVSEAFASDDRGATYRPIDADGRLRGTVDWRFLENGSAWAITDSTVLRSADEGTTWSVAGTFAAPLEALAAFDSATAAVAGADRIHLTRSGGRGWSSGTLPPG